MGKKKRKKEKSKKRKSLWRAFWITLIITLFAGAAALLAVLFLKKEEIPAREEELSKIYQVEKEDILSKTEGGQPAEDGSQKGQKQSGESEETGESAKSGEQTEANKGYGEDGCIRSETGRILEKNQATADDEATLLFAGDILFDDNYTIMITMRKRGSIRACFSEETLREMEEADIFMLNNEFTYTNRGEPTPEKQFTFRAKPDTAAMLRELGVDIVSLANNHAYDYGEISLLDSLDTLEKIDMPYVGAGRNLSEASETVYFQAGNQKIAFLSATQIERNANPDTKGATETSPGVFRCLNEQEIFTKIAEAKEKGAFVVVYIHWGTEKTDELDWAQPGMAKSLADAGADLIIGDHPHVLQPIANVDGVPTVYSLGNYWFNSSTLDTCLVKVKLKDGEMQSFQFLPALQSNCYTELLTGAEKERVLAYMRSISGTVSIDAEGYVTF